MAVVGHFVEVYRRRGLQVYVGKSKVLGLRAGVRWRGGIGV